MRLPYYYHSVVLLRRNNQAHSWDVRAHHANFDILLGKDVPYDLHNMRIHGYLCCIHIHGYCDAVLRNGNDIVALLSVIVRV